ncbi:recombinase [Alistipes sp. An54]|uniref:recombinase n=1 Tax=Alistipes sp. An54 TaxID=1965645 RepID=UPI0026D1B2B9
MVQNSALRCVSGIWQNNEKPLISNGLRSVVTYLLTAALWVLFHQRRHTFAVLQLSLGTEIYTLSKLLGHRELKTTQVYAQIIDEKKREAVNRIPEL